MAFMDMIDDLAEKCGLNRGDRMQYGLVGLVILVIVFSGITLFSTMTGGPSRGNMGPTEPPKYWCLEKQEVFTIDFSDLPESERMEKEMMYQHEGLVPSPLSGKLTGVAMTKCPSCKEWFVSEAALKGDPSLPAVCKNEECGIDINDWYRKKRAERRGR